MPNTPTLDQLKRGLAISEQIAALQAEMAALFNGLSPTPAASTSAKSDGRTGKRSAKTIARMKASQQARWAKIKGTKVKVPAAKAPAPAAKAQAPAKKKRTISPEHRAKLVASAKARWAAKKK